jgi:hypothetical protein
VFNVSAGYNSYGSVAGRGGVGGQSFCANPSTAGNAGLQAAYADMPITSEQTLYYSLTGSNGTPSLGVVISGYSF